MAVKWVDLFTTLPKRPKMAIRLKGTFSLFVRLCDNCIILGRHTSNMAVKWVDRFTTFPKRPKKGN